MTLFGSLQNMQGLHMNTKVMPTLSRDSKTAPRFVLQAMGFSILLLAGTTYVGHAFAQAATDPAQSKSAVTPEKPQGHGMRHNRGDHMVSRMDTDKDGAVSRAELQAAQQKQLDMFDRADVNKDGKLSADERKAFHETMRAENRGKRG
jgi:Spy/CpxP family protein refolding chaperone